MRQLFRELKRRHVFRVAAVYAVVAWLVIQVANVVLPRLGLPAWTVTFVIVLVALGFPLALVLAWAFEMTAEGVRRTPAGKGEGERPASMPPEERRVQSRLAMKALVGLGLVGAAVAGGWYLIGGGGQTEPGAGDRSIAVLPFEALSAGERSRTFARGIHDDLLTRLAHVSGLKVISRTAVQQYRDTDLSTGEVADSLGVRWVMEGGVQVLGDQIQVNAQLIDPRTETHTWADSYRRELTAEDLFSLQSEITKRIAHSLEAELTTEEERQVERQPTGDLRAYRLYVKGRDHLDTRTEDGVRKAVDYFRRAIRHDSSYALAWAGLADAAGLYPAHGPHPVPASLPDQEAAARRALELGPDLAEAHASMGFDHMTQTNGPAAVRELGRALELKPSYAQAHHWLGWTYLHLGRPGAAREHLSLAVELDPRHTTARTALVAAILAGGEVEAAQRHLDRVPDDQRSVRPYKGIRATVLHHAGRWEELERFAREQLRAGEAGSSEWRFHLVAAAARRGNTAAARERLRSIAPSPDSAPLWERNRPLLYQGLGHAALGEADEAFADWRRLEASVAPATWAVRYLYPGILAPLRDDPRYRKLIRELNQQWGLNPDGSLPDSVAVWLGEPSDG